MAAKTLSESARVSQESGAAFFVATNGNDAWSGKLSEPNAEQSDGPFATLARARDAVRETRTDSGLTEPATVMVRGGKYYLDEPLGLGAEDSGTRGCPVTYTAYPQEEPILSGGRRVTGWEPYQGDILQCPLPGTKGGKWKFRQLFFNGRRQIRARYPKFDRDNPLYGGWAFPESLDEEGSLVAFKYKPGTFKRHWEKPTEAEVRLVFRYGVTNIIPIKAVDEENHVITMVHSVKDFDVYPWFVSKPIRGPWRFYVENVLEELEQPGEWCLDAEEGIIYFWPPESIEAADVVAPVLDCLIDLRHASWITISGFTFTETTSGENMHRPGHEGYGGMFPRPNRRYCGEALHMRGAEHCTIADNHFCAVGGNAIYIEDYNAWNFIQHNEISHAGACGICLIGSRYRQPHPHHPIYNQVLDNHVHHGGVFDKYTAGVFLGLSDGNVIGHNCIEYLPHHAINLGSSGYGRNIVEYNEIRHTCLESHDNGAINCWMEDPHGYTEPDAQRSGHLIRYNRISDTRGCLIDSQGNFAPGGHAFGIYLDNYTSNCLVHGSLIVRSGGDGGIYVNSGKNNIIENNIVVGCVRQFSANSMVWMYPQMGDFLTGNRCCRNIFFCGRADAHLYVLGYWTDRVLGECDYNLFFNTAGGDFTISIAQEMIAQDETIIPLADWQKWGYDRHSLIADPMFVDPEHDDYCLRPESPAFKLGFQPIDTAGIGPRKRP